MPPWSTTWMAATARHSRAPAHRAAQVASGTVPVWCDMRRYLLLASAARACRDRGRKEPRRDLICAVRLLRAALHLCRVPASADGCSPSPPTGQTSDWGPDTDGALPPAPGCPWLRESAGLAGKAPPSRERKVTFAKVLLARTGTSDQRVSAGAGRRGAHAAPR